MQHAGGGWRARRKPSDNRGIALSWSQTVGILQTYYHMTLEEITRLPLATCSQRMDDMAAIESIVGGVKPPASKEDIQGEIAHLADMVGLETPRRR